MRYLLLLLLAGCAMDPTQYREMLASHCSGYGYTRGTLEHAQCMERTNAQAQANQAQRNRAAMEAGRQINAPQGSALDAYALPQQNAPLRPPTNTHCRPDGLGGMICTTY